MQNLGAVLLTVVAAGSIGCYGPNAQSGAPCDPTQNNCPPGQMCVVQGTGHVCSPTGGTGDDAPVTPDTFKFMDAPGDPNGDADGDGIKNGVDNCPTVANPGQENEDGDPFGDVCDPCPPFASTTEPDGDGDGVGDACDPHPNTAGDHIYLFEGFDHGVPSSTGWDPFGGVTAPADHLTISSAASYANLGYTMPSTGRETIWTKVTVTTASAADANAGILDEKGASTEEAIGCDLATVNGSASVAVVHAAAAATSPTIDQSTAFAWITNTGYLLKLVRDGTQYTCSSGGSTALHTETLVGTTPEIALWVWSASAKFDYLFVVTSP